jgi:hypothetical protein
MSDSDHKNVTAALFLVLKPIAKMLLRVGLGYREFANIAKSVFVEVASEEFGVRGRQTNTSRIAAMNGISRKEVSRLRGSDIESLSDLTKREAPLYVLLHVWETDQRYIDDKGFPRMLSFSGGDISFSSLVEECVGDIPPGAVRTELKRVGAISELPDKTLRVENTCFMPVGASERMVIGLGSLYALADTVEFNSHLDGQQLTRLQRLVVVDKFPEGRVRGAKEHVEAKLKLISEELDDYLTQEVASSSETGSKTRIGIGVYYYEMPDIEEYW